jgi:hypothetical protein
MPIEDFKNFNGLKNLENKFLIPNQENKLNFRYGIIQLEDLVRDLNYWETLCVSSMM